MQVEIQPATGSPLRLTGTRPEEGVQSSRLEHERSQDLIRTVRGVAAQGRDYGNEAHALAFAITREHDSPGAAAYYHLTHPSSVPPTGRVKFTLEDPDGRLIGVCYLEDAIIIARSATFDGYSTTTTYEIRGGSLTTGTAPA